MERLDYYLKDNLRLFSPSTRYRLDGVGAVGSNRWTWMGLGFIAIMSSWRCRGVKGFHLGFSGLGKHAQGSYVEAAASASFLLKRLVFFIEKSSSLSVAKSVGPSSSTYGANKLESPTSDQQFDFLPRNVIRLPRHENICSANEFGGSESRSINEPMQHRRGKITFSSDIIYDVGWEEKCKGSLLVMNDGEGRGRQLGPSMSHNCIDLRLWRRVESFEIQFGWDRLQSLRLGYDWDWNCYTGRSVLNLDNLSIYPLRYINIPNALDSPTRNLVKLFSPGEDAVTSVDMAWDMGLSCTCTIGNTVLLWDSEVGKPFNELMVDDYAIVDSHIGDSPGFLLNGVMMREEKGSLFVWDRRDFQRPLNFCVGNISTSRNVDFKENKVYVSDRLNERQYDIRMMHQQRPKYVEERSLLYYH